jgi:hypothetical protein
MKEFSPSEIKSAHIRTIKTTTTFILKLLSPVALGFNG